MAASTESIANHATFLAANQHPHFRITLGLTGTAEQLVQGVEIGFDKSMLPHRTIELPFKI